MRSLSLHKTAILLFLLAIHSWDGNPVATAWKPRKSSCSLSQRADSHHVATTTTATTTRLRGGGSWFPAGYHPLGYKITELGEQFLAIEGSLEGDIGRFLASLKRRKTVNALKRNWLEVVRVAKTAQAMRIRRKLEEYIAFCLAANLID